MTKKVTPLAWQGYRRRNWLAAGLLVGGLPAAFAVAIAASIAFEPASEFVLFAAVLSWCLAWGWAAFRVARWPCPRCDIPWLSSQEPRLGVPRRCGRCGLALYEAP